MKILTSNNPYVEQLVSQLSIMAGGIALQTQMVIEVDDGPLAEAIQRIMDAANIPYQTVGAPPAVKRKRSGACIICGKPTSGAKACDDPDCKTAVSAEYKRRMKKRYQSEQPTPQRPQHPVYLVIDGDLSGQTLTSDELTAKMRLGTLPAGTHVRHDLRGLFVVTSRAGKTILRKAVQHG